MNALLPSWQRLSESWLQWMIGTSCQVVLVAAVLTALTWLLRRRSAVFHYALWTLILVRLVVPPSFAFPTGWGWWVRSAGTDKTAADIGRQETSPAGTSALTTNTSETPATAPSASQPAVQPVEPDR